MDNDDQITATDAAGNITQIDLASKDRKHQDKAQIKSLSYNGQLVDLSKNLLAFDWSFDKKQNLSTLNQHVRSKKDFNIDALYSGTKTTITGKDQSGKINKSFNSIVLLKITTNKGDLDWNY